MIPMEKFLQNRLKVLFWDHFSISFLQNKKYYFGIIKGLKRGTRKGYLNGPKRVKMDRKRLKLTKKDKEDQKRAKMDQKGLRWTEKG